MRAGVHQGYEQKSHTVSFHRSKHLSLEILGGNVALGLGKVISEDPQLVGKSEIRCGNRRTHVASWVPFVPDVRRGLWIRFQHLMG